MLGGRRPRISTSFETPPPAKGDNTGWHRHLFDYLVVPVVDGTLEMQEPSGETRLVRLRRGVPYWRNQGVEHEVINAGDTEMVFIEIEFL